jgi:hypothetical protein
MFRPWEPPRRSGPGIRTVTQGRQFGDGCRSPGPPLRDTRSILLRQTRDLLAGANGATVEDIGAMLEEHGRRVADKVDRALDLTRDVNEIIGYGMAKAKGGT